MNGHQSYLAPSSLVVKMVQIFVTKLRLELAPDSAVASREFPWVIHCREGHLDMGLSRWRNNAWGLPPFVYTIWTSHLSPEADGCLASLEKWSLHSAEYPEKFYVTQSEYSPGSAAFPHVRVHCLDIAHLSLKCDYFRPLPWQFEIACYREWQTIQRICLIQQLDFVAKSVEHQHLLVKCLDLAWALHHTFLWAISFVFYMSRDNLTG